MEKKGGMKLRFSLIGCGSKGTGGNGPPIGPGGGNGPGGNGGAIVEVVNSPKIK